MHQQIEFIIESLLDIASKNYPSQLFLSEIYTLLSGFIPIDTMHIGVYDTSSETITCKALVINKKVMLLKEVFHLDKATRELAHEMKDQKYLIVNNSNEIDVAKEITNHFNTKATVSLISSSIVRPNDSLYSAITFAAYGENRYQPEHFSLLDNLTQPLKEISIKLLLKVEKDAKKSKSLTDITEIRTALEHQRIDLTLNSQFGLKSVVNQIEQVGPLDSPVLITGETGVGKDLIAKMLHGLSKRSEGPFIAVNCGALPESLLDSELFGYEKGAFTGAAHNKAGYFEQADKGIIFLDEVGELSVQAQTKLLRVIQNQTFQRVGGEKPVSIDVRVVAATNRNIPDMIKAQLFREDLWYRLNVFPIEVPPLRERKQDMPILVQYLMNSKIYEMNLPYKPQLSSKAMEQLIEYNWPGNIRELQNILERALILSKGSPLSFPDLVPNKKEENTDNTILEKEKFPTMDEMNRKHIHQSLKLSNGKIGGPGGAAELLGMNPSTLRAKLKKLKIKVSRTCV